MEYFQVKRGRWFDNRLAAIESGGQRAGSGSFAEDGVGDFGNRAPADCFLWLGGLGPGFVGGVGVVVGVIRARHDE